MVAIVSIMEVATTHAKLDKKNGDMAKLQKVAQGSIYKWVFDRLWNRAELFYTLEVA